MTTGVSVRTLASPAFVLALVVLVLNDHVLKHAYPGALTGKLSDVAGLVVAPLLLGVLLTAWRVRRPMPVALCATAIGFTVTKTTTVGAAAVSTVWGLTGVPTLIRADVTDLLALPALYVGWLVHRRTAAPPTGDWRSSMARVVGVAMVPVAVLATAATSCDDSGFGNHRLTVVRGDFFGPPEGPEMRVLYDGDLSVDDTGSVAVLPEYDRARMAPGGDYDDGTRTCDDRGTCWRIGDQKRRVVEISHDGGGSWQQAYELPASDADRALEGVGGEDCGGNGPVADLDELAVVGSGPRSVVAVSASSAGLLIRAPDGDWRLLSEEDLDDLERLPEPRPTPSDGLISPIPARPSERETPGPTCQAPITVSATPNPQNGPPTVYTYCP